jgi:hypothetical protein
VTLLPTRKFAAMTLPTFTVQSVLSDLFKHAMCALILSGTISATVEHSYSHHKTSRLRLIYLIARRAAPDVPKV